MKTGEILVAPGGLHMVLSKQGDKTIVLLEDTPPVNFCKPAVDPLFKSAVPIYGNAILSLGLGRAITRVRLYQLFAIFRIFPIANFLFAFLPIANCNLLLYRHRFCVKEIWTDINH